MRTLIWFRQDLRLRDNPALFEAAKVGEVLPIYVWTPAEKGNWPLGEQSSLWLAHSLKALDQSLRKKGGVLFYFRGSAKDKVLEIVKKYHYDRVFWNCSYSSYMLGLQWISRCGAANAAPNFRICNLTIQGKKIDCRGQYFKQFIPELKNAPERFIHTPWEIQEGYPSPIVDHNWARQRALDSFDLIKRKK